MSYKIMELTPEQEAKAWNDFSQHNSCAVLHNECLTRIEDLRTKLESIAPEQLQTVQGQIIEARYLLDLLHSKQTPEVKKNYEHDTYTT